MQYANIDEQNECEIRVEEQLGGKDPDEYIREFGAQLYKEQIKKAHLLLDYELNQLTKKYSKDTTPQAKSVLLQQITDILKEIKNPVILADYFRTTAYKIDLVQMIFKKQVAYRQYYDYPFSQFNFILFVQI